MVINYHKKNNPGSRGRTGVEANIFILEVLLNCTSLSVKNAPKTLPEPAKLGEAKELQVIPVLLEAVVEISAIRLFLPDDLRPPDARRQVERCLDEVIKRFDGDLSKLDPILDMNVKEEAFKELEKKRKLLEGRLVAHDLHSSPDLETLYTMFREKERLQTEAKQVAT